MTKKEMYKKMVEIQNTLWKDGGDMVDQETLYVLQKQIADLALEVAYDARKEMDLVKVFPYLYHVAG